MDVRSMAPVRDVSTSARSLKDLLPGVAGGGFGGLLAVDFGQRCPLRVGRLRHVLDGGVPALAATRT
jgi:hypothetical protein